jgi:hypothetical protein
VNIIDKKERSGMLLADKDDKRRRSDDPLCKSLKRFLGENVTLHMRSGDTYQGILIRVKNGVVELRETVMVSPFEESQLVFTRCRDIESFSVSTS